MRANTPSNPSGKNQRDLSGWYAVARSLLNSPLWLSEPFTRGQAWIDLIGLARFEPGYLRIKGCRVDLARGELAWSEGKLGERWKWSRGKVRRFLKELETEQRIVQRKSHVTSVIAITNYDTYQSHGTANGTTDGTTDSTTDGTRNNKDNNLTKKTTSWRLVGEKLSESGVAAVTPAVEAARNRGATPDEVLSLISEFRSKPGAWTAGALYRMATGEIQCWPEPSTDYSREQSRLATNNSAAATVEKHHAQRAEHEADRRCLANLEQLHGARLDAMSDEQRETLLLEAEPDPLARKLLGSLSRRVMLEQLAGSAKGVA